MPVPIKQLTSPALTAALERELMDTVRKPLTVAPAKALEELYKLYKQRKPVSSNALHVDKDDSSKPGDKRLRGAAKDPHGIVRQHIMQIRKAFSEFELTIQARRNQLRIELPNQSNRDEGAYQLVFHEQEVHSKKSWRRYIESGRDVLIVYTAPQFFRLGRHVFLRHQSVNRDSIQEVKEKFNWDEQFNDNAYDTADTSRHFVSVGESHAALMLTRWFERMDIKTDHMIARQWEDIKFDGRNIVVMGNERTLKGMNARLKDQGFDYKMGDYCILDRNSPEPIDDVFKEEQPVRGIVSGFYDGDHDCLMTVLSSNHGRFFAGAARAMTRDWESGLFWQELGLGDLTSAPEKFQFIGQVNVTKDDDPMSSDPMKVLRPVPRKSAAVDSKSPDV